MAKNPLGKGVLTENFTGIGSVTHEMVYKRARGLALLAGCAPPQIRQSDYEQAKRELTGGTDIDRQDTVLESLPETERWNPVPGSDGQQTPESTSKDPRSKLRGIFKPNSPSMHGVRLLICRSLLAGDSVPHRLQAGSYITTKPKRASGYQTHRE